jgi:hypothetical protein
MYIPTTNAGGYSSVGLTTQISQVGACTNNIVSSTTDEVLNKTK